jgi:hypothetical protein
VKITAINVIDSYSAVSTADLNVIDAQDQARGLRWDAAICTSQAISSRGATATSIADAVKAKREELKAAHKERVDSETLATGTATVRIDEFVPDLAYTSDTMVGYVAMAGTVALLPGDMDEYLTVLELMMAVKAITITRAKAIIRAKAITSGEAAVKILAEAKVLTDAKSAESKSALKYLKAATGPVGKATEFEDATWDAATVAAAEALLDALEAKLAAVRSTPLTIAA